MLFILYGFWLILNGRITPEILLIGIAVCVPVYVFAVFFLGFSPKKELRLLKKLLIPAAYVPVLLFEILKANFSVLGFILSPSKKPEPVVVSFKAPLESPTLRTVLANSITLTPGTITLNEADGLFTVHCLDGSMSHGLDTSVFVRLLSRMER